MPSARTAAATEFSLERTSFWRPQDSCRKWANPQRLKVGSGPFICLAECLHREWGSALTTTVANNSLSWSLRHSGGAAAPRR